ncbi:MAG: hypothetical protein COA71_14645 [SAR86 cluster bacterium]|uniref:Uncharacterized protein n=1 Tax=SAR86 cluster bacterium TaxID=2030880 RepID=A0A2A5C5J2_9GAMM|nr:MAG: hypothetical protein COA71_14645 [SAR86 cluster bacterium]
MNIKDLEDNVTNDISNVIDKIKIDTDADGNDIYQVITDAVKDSYPDNGVIYVNDAFNIITSSAWPSAENVDFTGMTSSLDCLMQEANNAYMIAYDEHLSEISHELAEEIMEMINKAVELGFEGDFEISDSTIYGWEAHNYETNEGTCVWSDEEAPYAYNPSLLEGELWAIEKTVGPMTIGAAWYPEK